MECIEGGGDKLSSSTAVYDQQYTIAAVGEGGSIC